MSSAGAYDPRSVEREILELWEGGGLYEAHADPGRAPYTIVIPPPNVTGALHLGHALNDTLQDILIRTHRMRGYVACWLPGTDHAGIATQAVVEKRLKEEEGLTRHQIGREGLVKRIWAWKEEYNARIVDQLRRMGCSCDWRRMRFTLDEVCARAVYETFFRMFKDGLIYRGTRLVNWDCELQTAVADDEVYHETVHGHLWHVRYAIEGSGFRVPGSDARPGVDYLVVATTRPETMLGDTAVAVHPDDARYRHLIGRQCILPLMNRRIPIIADPLLVNPEFGTGCVKVTPAHDSNDYACYQRHPHIGIVNILTPDGRINENGRSAGPALPGAPDAAVPRFDYVGLGRYEARKRVVADLERLGLLERIEPYETDIGHSDRSKTPIEPMLSQQWFVRMDSLAELAMEAVRDGRVRFFPERFARSYLDWLGEKRDWCISRQLWWGHRIPVWSRRMSVEQFSRLLEGDGRAIVAAGNDLNICVRIVRDDGSGFSFSGEPSLARLRSLDRREELDWHVCLRDPELRWPGDSRTVGERLEADGFVRDPDVLDTWFSSALWPHSTFGWPGSRPPSQEATEPRSEGRAASVADLDYFYPTSVLVTNRDIISLWVARMVMTGLYNVGRVPFAHVLIHPTIQDGHGRRMSKSLGNGVDPMDLIELYGTDAMRFTLASLAGETQDVRIPVRPARLPDGREVNSSERFELGRNFCNKLWQAATGYILPNVRDLRIGPSGGRPHHPGENVVRTSGSQSWHTTRPPAELPLFDRWIRTRLLHCMQTVDDHLAHYRFGQAADALRTFVWSEFCDWYLEESKLRVQSGDEGSINDAKVALLQTLDICLCLLHPFMPFITEDLWQRISREIPRHHELIWPERDQLSRQPQLRAAWGDHPPPQAPPLIRMPWPAPWPAAWQPECERAVGDVLQPAIRALRDIRATANAIRAQQKQPALRSLPRAIIRANPEVGELLAAHEELLKRLARCEQISLHEAVDKPPGSMTKVLTGMEVHVPLAGLADLDVERTRLRKERAELAAHLARMEAKLANESFVSKAPPAVVEGERARLAELKERLATIGQNLADVGA
jgi:valyl-tRNA synthetase